MIYLYWYIGIGVSVLVLIYGAHRFTKKGELESLYDLFDTANPDREKLSFLVLNKIIAPALAVVAVVIFWPVAAYMKLTDRFTKKNESGLGEEREFSVEPGHLQERLTAQEIEAHEMVEDPLGAVPNLPFGHLNAAWRNFLDSRSDGDELWSFTARWETTWGQKELLAGYVLVRNDCPGAHFLTVWKGAES